MTDRQTQIKLTNTKTRHKTNTKTRHKDVFVPIDPDNVRMYVCGPTVYDRAHIGNARPVIVFDVLYRLLRHVYGADHVTYVRNFTDVDDKINAKAAETGRSIREITDETMQWYLDDMRAVGALDPDKMPRATEYIGAMISMIEGLVESGHAYAAEGHVLFAVESYKDYGKLSGRSIDDMIAGARVEVAPYKRNPMDFVLWKPSSEDQPGWDSPWGYGRPGWHIECSAMSYELLGETFDIHGGGNDLMFPHHENEIAQSCCAHEGAGFANYWLHNEMLQVEGKKMSKSLGNFFTVRDLLDGHDGQAPVPGEVIRFVFLSTHYRKPMDWTAEKAEQARKKLAKWRRLLSEVGEVTVNENHVDPFFLEALSNDLNTASALKVLDGLGQELSNALLSKRQRAVGDLNYPESSRSSEVVAAELKSSAQILGLLLDDLGGWETKSSDQYAPLLDELSKKISVERIVAMQTKDFAPVDALKTALLDAGVEVRMSKTGVELEAGPNFDASKLEGLL
ncbi:cysteine--tRNA ligase [Celeribacter sp.]|uniref:cysteine--tRNA ligase n=1 Tax=Celeribacter sp. TaxID=1890673 RepID=UPI003A95C3A9